jgi:hypothetical protein
VTIEDLSRQFNVSLMEMNIDNAKALLLSRDKSMEDVRSVPAFILFYLFKKKSNF